MSLDDSENCLMNVENVSPWSPVSENSNESTRSSSTQSWLDETEISTTKELQEQYDKFEAALYLEENASDLPKSLQDEIKIWSEHSPHIRVRGVKANIIEQSDSLHDDNYDGDYEEVLASHGTLEENLEKTLSFSEDVKEVIGNCPSDEQDVIKEDLKNAIVDKLFDQAWPKVLEKFEPVIKSMSARRKKNFTQSFDNTDSSVESLKNQLNIKSAASRSNSSRSYMRELSSRKPFVDSKTEYQSLLSSHGLRGYYRSIQPNTRTTVSINQKSAPKASVNRTSSFSMSQVNQKSHQSAKYVDKKTNKAEPIRKCDQSIILPPIEVLAITPQEPDKKCLSAWMRFSKTLPRVGSNTSKNRNISQKPPEKIEDKKKRVNTGFHRKDNLTHFDPGMQVVGTRSATSVKNNRWRH